MNKQKLNILLLLFLFLFTCEKTKEKLPVQPPKPVYFSKSWKAEIDFVNCQYCVVYRDVFNNLVAIIYSQADVYESVSHDNGISWTPSVKILDFRDLGLPIIVQKQFLGIQTFTNVDNGGQSFLHIRTKNGWNKPLPIRDTYWGNFGAGVFAKDSTGNIYCAWTDYREGNPDVYFSSSTDNGKSWNVNVRINDDRSGQAQAMNCLLLSPGGILYAFWEDNRNPKTLYDIYFSSSRDGGKTWSDNIRINDDTTHCWQRSANAVFDQKGDIYVAWYDYRDKGIHNDLIGNIYFSKSKNSGET
ncbi:exo-alpha-sialidase [candidate division KSB1 bacterium]|nr:exo-alpha-sialidase [candidate division KSB1 bacterium]MBL7094044.1 exo-alpha-sialidase [candidate division KSB1 bacterium]